MVNKFILSKLPYLLGTKHIRFTQQTRLCGSAFLTSAKLPSSADAVSTYKSRSTHDRLVYGIYRVSWIHVYIYIYIIVLRSRCPETAGHVLICPNHQRVVYKRITTIVVLPGSGNFKNLLEPPYWCVNGDSHNGL